MSHSQASANGARQGGGNCDSHSVSAQGGECGSGFGKNGREENNPAGRRRRLAFQLTTTIEVVSTGLNRRLHLCAR